MEELIKEVAEKHMTEFDLESFKGSHPSLYKVIVELAEGAADRQKFLNDLDEHLDWNHPSGEGNPEADLCSIGEITCDHFDRWG